VPTKLGEIRVNPAGDAAAGRVKEFRLAHSLKTKSAAFRWLLDLGLEAAAKKDPGTVAG
jgi:hypothetical protein